MYTENSWIGQSIVRSKFKITEVPDLKINQRSYLEKPIFHELLKQLMKIEKTICSN